MGNYTLKVKHVLDGFDHDFDGTRLRELVDMAAVSVSVPMGGEDALAKKLKSSFGVGIPAVGESYVGKDGSRLVGFSADQFLVLFDHEPHSGVSVMEEKLGNTAYYCEQTNNWVFLELSGDLSRPALERICAVNTSPDKYAIDKAERTSMEHMGAVLIRTGEDTFVVMSASSTGPSFLHAIETSIKFVS